MLPDRWNPRLWIRDWLNRQTANERASWQAIYAEIAALKASTHHSEASNTLVLDAKGGVVGFTRVCKGRAE
ncbi:hypothetical protein FHR58_000371 [Xanthomonas arboricola]|nr:hypothetical protein [Xanthomonas arboricola]